MSSLALILRLIRDVYHFLLLDFQSDHMIFTIDHSKGFGGKFGVQKDRVDEVSGGILKANVDRVFSKKNYLGSFLFDFFNEIFLLPRNNSS